MDHLDPCYVFLAIATIQYCRSSYDWFYAPHLTTVRSRFENQCWLAVQNEINTFVCVLGILKGSRMRAVRVLRHNNSRIELCNKSAEPRERISCFGGDQETNRVQKTSRLRFHSVEWMLGNAVVLALFWTVFAEPPCCRSPRAALGGCAVNGVLEHFLQSTA